MATDFDDFYEGTCFLIETGFEAVHAANFFSVSICMQFRYGFSVVDDVFYPFCLLNSSRGGCEALAPECPDIF
jgi:hypothetical protein